MIWYNIVNFLHNVCIFYEPQFSAENDRTSVNVSSTYHLYCGGFLSYIVLIITKPQIHVYTCVLVDTAIVVVVNAVQEFFIHSAITVVVQSKKQKQHILYNIFYNIF
jgi:hypothetical protein